MTVTQTVEIPVDRQVSLKLPHALPIGKAKIIIFSQADKEAEAACVYENCPLCSDNPPFNDTTLAAMQEARDIASGKIPVKWHQSIEEAIEELEGVVFSQTGTHSDML